MVKSGISIYSARSYIVGPTKHLERVVQNRESSSPNRKKKKLNKMEFLGASSGPHVASGGSSADG